MDLNTNKHVDCKDYLSFDSPRQSIFDLRYVSLNASGPFRHSIRALVLCNSRECVESHNKKTDKPRAVEAHTTLSTRRSVVSDDENKTQADETSTDTRRILLSDSIDSNKLKRSPCNVFIPNINRDSFIRSKDKYSNKGFTFTCDISCSTEYFECRNRGTQKISNDNLRKQSFATKCSPVKRESKATFKNEIKSVVNAECGTSRSQLVEEKNCTEKSTYCRPIVNMYSQMINKCNERNNKLQKMVRKLIEAREREKQKEAWDNYINGLKNKHGVSTLDVVDVDEYLDTSSTNQSGTCTHLLQDIYAPNNKLHPHHIYSRPALFPDNSIHRHDRRRRYKCDQLCYPISSQGRLLMSQREKKNKYGFCENDFMCNHGAKNKIIVPKVQGYKKCRTKSKTKIRCSSIQTDDKPSLYEEQSEQEQRVSVKVEREERDINTRSESQLKREHSENEMDERLERERGENERNARLEMEAEERLQKEDGKKDKFARPENGLKVIESKLDALIDSIYTLIVELKTKNGVQPAPVPENTTKCTLATCISRKNLAPFLEDSSDETVTNVPRVAAKCCRKKLVDQDNKVCQTDTKKKNHIENESSDIDDNQPNSSQRTSVDNGNVKPNALKRTSIGYKKDDHQPNSLQKSPIDNDNEQQNMPKKTSICDKNDVKDDQIDDPDTPCHLCTDTCLHNDQKNLRRTSFSDETKTTNGANKRQKNNSNNDKTDKTDKIVCCMSTEPSFTFSERFRTSKLNKILIEEIDKSNQAKREIEEILNRELSRPCNVQITIDIPTKEISTEVTTSLSKTRQNKTNEERRMTIAVNTDPLSLLSLLRISRETIGRLLSTVNYNSYLSMIQLPQLSRRIESTGSQISRYICNVCGAIFMRASQLNSHFQVHSLGNYRDCCVCRHVLDLQRRPAGRFLCHYCGRRFTRSYCCELHQQSCAKKFGRIHNADESLILLQ